MSKGTFYCVGVGPGDPELLTLKAARTIERCDVIACPETQSGQSLAWDIAASAVDLSGKTRLPLSFPMERSAARRAANRTEAAARAEEYLAQGSDVAMLVLGDVSVYATGAYVAELLQERDYRTERIPSVPSFCAAAARLGVSLAEGNEAFHVIPGSADLDAALALLGTRVFMKSGKELPELMKAIEKQKLSAMAVRNCGMPGEELYPDLSQSIPGEDAGYFVTVIVKDKE